MEWAQSAMGLETAVAKFSTLADTSVIPLETLKTGFQTLSDETGVAAAALVEAGYQALSAGVKTADVANFVTTATKTSIAGFTDAATAVDVLTTTLNAYKMEGTEAERVASMLVKTQDEGKTSVGELASNMGKIIPTAAAYNVSLENLTTSYALLTKSGTSTKIATTNLTAMLDELATTGGTVARILAEQTGKSFSELMASGSNLVDVLMILADSVDNDATAFSNLWSNSTAGKAAISLLNTGAEEFNRTLDVMADCSGAVEENFQIMAATTEFAHQRMMNAAENLKISIGDQLTPALEQLYESGATAFTWATDFVRENPWIVGAITGVTAAVAALSLGVGALAAAPQIIAALKTAFDLLAANPIVAVSAALVGLTVAVATWTAASREAGEGAAALTTSIRESKAAYEELKEALETERSGMEASIASLKELLEIENKSATQKEVIAQRVAELNEALPELNLTYNEEKDALEGLTAAEVENAAKRAAAQEEHEAQISRLSELYDEQTLIGEQLANKQVELDEILETSLTGFIWHVGDVETAVYELTQDVLALTEAQEENAEQIAELEEATEAYTAEQEAAAAAAEEAAVKLESMTSRVEGLAAEMENLQAAYEESYASAMESIDGQLGLFNELDGSAKTSIDSLIGTLQGQVEYMETYAANIQRAMELGVDEGLIRKLSDGSEESAQILAAIVEGGEEDIAALNEQLAKVEEGKAAFSNTVAEMETDFSRQMEALVRDLDAAMQDMDLSDETYQIGEDNIQGLINGTASRKRELVNTYAEMGRAALAAYKKEVAQASPSRKFQEAGSFDIQGIIAGAEQEKDNLDRAYADAGRTALLAMERSLPSQVVEPPVTAALGSQTAAITAAISALGGETPPIQIYVDRLEVREDSDVEQVARQLYYLMEQKRRSKGGGSL